LIQDGAQAVRVPQFEKKLNDASIVIVGEKNLEFGNCGNATIFAVFE
jgi:hypothetical protein